MTTDPALSLYLKGNDLLNSDQPEPAIVYYKKALKLNPTHPVIYHNLAIAFERTGRIELAIDYYQHAIKIAPDMAIAHYNLGNLYLNQGDYHKAIKKYDQALAHQPKFYEALINKGISQNQLNLNHEAVKTFKTAVTIKNHPEAYNNVAMNLMVTGNIESAFSYFKSGHDLFPNSSVLAANYYRAAITTCDWDISEKMAKKITALTQKDLNSNIKPGETPYATLFRSQDPQTVYQVSRAHGTLIDKPLKSFINNLKRPKNHPKHNKLRIGYLSYDFRDHVNTYHLLSLFKNHDKKQV